MNILVIYRKNSETGRVNFYECINETTCQKSSPSEKKSKLIVGIIGISSYILCFLLSLLGIY